MSFLLTINLNIKAKSGMFSSDGNLGDERMPLDASEKCGESVGKVRKKCANSRESAAGPGSRGDSGSQESGLGTRESRESGVGTRELPDDADSHLAVCGMQLIQRCTICRCITTRSAPVVSAFQHDDAIIATPVYLSNMLEGRYFQVPHGQSAVCRNHSQGG